MSLRCSPRWGFRTLIPAPGSQRPSRLRWQPLNSPKFCKRLPIPRPSLPGLIPRRPSVIFGSTSIPYRGDTMRNDLYHIISGTSEDRFDRTDTLENALRIARSVVKRVGRVEEPVLIEHRGYIIRQFVLTPEGQVVEEICWPASEA